MREKTVFGGTSEVECAIREIAAPHKQGLAMTRRGGFGTTDCTDKVMG